MCWIIVFKYLEYFKYYNYRDIILPKKNPARNFFFSSIGIS